MKSFSPNDLVKRRKDPRLEFSQSEWLAPLEKAGDLDVRKMFGGLAVYFNGLQVLVLAENPDDFEWQGQRYPYAIWNGLLIVTSFQHHESLFKEWPKLVNHPVLKKWLYLPLTSDVYEPYAESLILAIRRGDERFGIVPGQRKRARQRRKSRQK